MSTLALKLEQITARAIADGSLLPLQVTTTTVNEQGLPYSINHLSSLSLKDMATAAQLSGGRNPFVPYEENLFVDDLSPTHLLLLNKFPIIRQHAMAITREFVAQSSPLNTADFKALALMMREINGLVMFNCGPASGASQPHRHLHIMPGRTAPLSAIYPQGTPGEIQRIEPFRFVHAFMRIDPAQVGDATYLQNRIEAAYAHCNLHPTHNEMPAYNLLGTREWLLIVPRSQSTFTVEDVTVRVSALDFGGLVSVRTSDQIEVVKRAGLLAGLEATAIMNI